VWDTGTELAVMAQFVMAGFMGALWFQHRAAWRPDRGNGGPFWLMLWSASLTMLFLVNGLLTGLPGGVEAAIVRFARVQILTATVLLALSVVKSLTGGRRIRWYVAAAGAMFAVRSVLWLTTDLIFAHTALNGIPQNGPLLGPSFLVPLAVVVWYVATSTKRLPVSRMRFGFQLAASLGLAGLVCAYLTPPGPGAELLKGVWALPLLAALHVMSQSHIRAADQRVARQRALRDALTEISDAASLATDSSAMLKVAETMAREQVREGSLVGSIRPRMHGPFSATFESPQGPPGDELTKDFLADLSRIVSLAAERISLVDSLREEALTDYLTRLPNRRALELHLSQALIRARQDGTRLGLLYGDVDDFKRENEKHGHAWGDEVLLRIANHLRESLSEGTFVARLGGDEFVVVVEHAGSLVELVELAKTIRTGVDLPGTHRIAPLLSVGVAVWSREDGTDPDLLREADAAMYEGRRSGVGVVVFDDALRAQMVDEQSLGREIEAALLGNEFTLHYQPIVDARTLGIVGVEALIRWPHCDGMRMPAQWIPFAEKTGLIVPIGRWVVVTAREYALRLGLPVAVNVAARQLAEPRFVEHLREDWGDADWHLLTLEITESELLEDLSQVISSLTEVRALGARISIDDFGTGHSSFARLANLPVDVLKIDQAFVRDLGSPGGVAVVRAIVTLARAYDLDIVAEGVERIGQLDILADLGVPKLQGYLLARPSPSVPQQIDLSAARSAQAAEADAERRDHTGQQPDNASDVRDQAGKDRDQAGEARNQAGKDRDHAGEDRDQAGEDRDQAGEDRDQAGEDRDQAGEDRDQAGEDRDQAGEDRDQAGALRDLAADQRDQSAELDAKLLSMESIEAALERAGVARLQAASDRWWSAQDRRAAASERNLADLDRDSAMTDRDRAMTDRGAAAGERTHADLDRDDAMVDRGASAKERGVASRDALTGVLRRGRGLLGLEREIARSRRTGAPLSLAFLDVDGLKRINDQGGHAAGDRMLLEVANTLRAKLRKYDLIFRYGGDEFVCVLTGLNATDASIRMSLVQGTLANGREHGSITVGIAALEDDDSLESLLARADDALYLRRQEQRAHAHLSGPDHSPVIA
jgi:diguanylate cyclase